MHEVWGVWDIVGRTSSSDEMDRPEALPVLSRRWWQAISSPRDLAISYSARTNPHSAIAGKLLFWI